ncbi:MAG: hypothetical protein AABZ74_10840 [Cyanobacteriota bacterium]
MSGISVSNKITTTTLNNAPATSSPENKVVENNTKNTLKNDSINVASKTPAVNSENPFDKSNEGRKVLQPTGKSNGQNFYFMYGLEGTMNKVVMRTPNKLAVMDDISRLRAKGYTVIVDDKMTTADFKNALYDQKAVGVVTLSHGGDGYIVTSETKDSDEGFVGYRDIETSKVSKNLKLAFFQACQVGTEQSNWNKAVGKEVIAWDYSVSNIEVIAANSHIGSAGIFPVVGSVFSIKNQTHGKALGKIIGERF